MKKIVGFFLMLCFFLSCSSKDADEVLPIKENLKIMTYNIHHGAPREPDVVNLEGIAAVIRMSGADIIALQEVDVNTNRSGGEDQARALAELLDMEYYFSKSIDYQGGDYGNAILSKFPLSNKRRFDLPMPVPGEKRSIAIATVSLPNGKEIEFGSTHFDLQASRVAQAEFLNEIDKDLNKPFFIGGDFNATPESEEIKTLQNQFTLACKGPCPLTIPERNPNKSIDFVIANKEAVKQFDLMSSVSLGGQYASDHLPVVAVYAY